MIAMILRPFLGVKPGSRIRVKGLADEEEEMVAVNAVREPAV